MKVQESLSQYLYETKKLTLPGIGHFTLDASVNVYEKNDATHLQHSIQFIPDASSKEDPELIAHLVKTTGKMKPLAMSDLESYLSTGIQLLNIGKPFILPGIGSISQMRDGFHFAPGQFTPQKIEDKVTENKFRDKTVEEPNFSSVEKEFDYEKGTRKNSRKWLMLLAALLIFALAGWGVYYFFIQKNDNTNSVSEETHIATDTAAIIPAKDSSLQKLADSLQRKPVSIAAIPDSIKYNYAIELREYTYLKSAAERVKILRTYGHKVFVETKDSVHHCLLFPINGQLTDSTRVIDSLSRLLLTPSSKRPKVRLN